MSPPARRLAEAAALGAAGDWAAALAAFDALAADRPAEALAWIGRGTALNALARPAEAIGAFRRAIELNPALSPASAGLATALQALGRHGEAVAQFRRALHHTPADAALRAGLAQSLRGTGALPEAESQARLAVHLDPAAPLGHLALGAALADQGETGAAIAAFRAGIACRPASAEEHTAIGMARLLLGDYPGGWQGYRHRPGAGPGWPPGTRLAGARIEVRPEQGLGDCLHFARYLPALAAQGATVGFDAPAPLRRLLAALPGVAEGRIRLEPLPDTNLSCALLDLGHLLGIMPGPLPVLPAPPAARPADGRLRIGLAWSGNPAHANDRARSAGPDAFAPLLALPGCRFILVQTDAAGAPPGVETPPLGDFADTAALMATLDAVVSVDTAPAHLAGALGRPLLLLLPALPDWRWGLAGDGTPWYPSARLHRQRRAGDWSAPIAAAEADLRRMIL